MAASNLKRSGYAKAMIEAFAVRTGWDRDSMLTIALEFIDDVEVPHREWSAYLSARETDEASYEPGPAPQGLDPGDDESDGEGDDELGDDPDAEHLGEIDDYAEHQLTARDLLRPDQLRPDYNRYT